MKINKKLLEDQKHFLLDVKEPFLVAEFLNQVNEALPDASLDLCYTIEDFLSHYHRGTLFEDAQHIIVLWDFLREEAEVIESLLDVPTEDVIVVVKRASIPKTKAYTRITTEYTIVKLESPSERGCTSWLRGVMKDEGLEFESGVPAYLVSHFGIDLYELYGEVRKLRCMGEKITVDVCGRVLAHTHEARFFDFIDALFRRRVPDTLREFAKVDEGSYTQLIHFMVGQIERVYRAAALKNQGESPEDIADILGVPKFILKTKILSAVASFGRVKLIMLLDLVNELEKKLRTTRLPRVLVFESYLLKAMRT